MSTRKSAKSAHAVARSRTLQDLRRQARNGARRAGQFVAHTFRAAGHGPRWAIVVAWICVSLSTPILVFAVAFDKPVPAFSAWISLYFGVKYLHRFGWWK